MHQRLEWPCPDYTGHYYVALHIRGSELPRDHFILLHCVSVFEHAHHYSHHKKYSLFGLMMICTEMKFANLQPRIQRKFGFLFTFIGRALFILLYVMQHRSNSTIRHLCGRFKCSLLDCSAVLQQFALPSTNGPATSSSARSPCSTLVSTSTYSTSTLCFGPASCPSPATRMQATRVVKT